jgi:hypothetical protein
MVIGEQYSVSLLSNIGSCKMLRLDLTYILYLHFHVGCDFLRLTWFTTFDPDSGSALLPTNGNEGRG